MTRYPLLLIALLLCLMIVAVAPVAVQAKPVLPTATPVPGLLFRDDFNGTALDGAKWTVTNGIPGYGAEHWVPGNCSVSKGALHLRADANYASCDVRTFGKFSFQYGYAEARIRIPAGYGLWPVFWLFSDLDNVPPLSRQEIDIMEDQTAWLNMTGFNVHWGNNADQQKTGSWYVAPGVDYSAAFHTYAMRWSPTEIKFYVDGVLRWTWAQPATPVVYDSMHIRLSLSICRTGLDWCPAPNGSTPFPSYMDVDWVRVEN